MRGIRIINPGPESQIVCSEQPVPLIGKDELLVEVKAAALNRADLLQREGKYPPPAGESSIPGLELAGNVLAIGQQVQGFKPGDRIYGLVAGGAFAEYCAVHQDLAYHCPSHWDYTKAAALPEALTTAHATLFLKGKLTKNERVLIHAAGSGITSLAIQMVHHLGAELISTASNEEKISRGLALGATSVIHYSSTDFVQALGMDSVDVVLDFIGGDYLTKHVQVLKPKGRLIQIACMQGRHASCDLLLLMKKQLSIHGFVLRSQSIAEKALLWASAHQQWLEPLMKGSITPVIDSIYPLTAIDEAQHLMKQGTHFGKIVITIP